MRLTLGKLKEISRGVIRDLHHFGFKVMLANVYCTWTDNSLKSIMHRNEILLQWLTKHNKDLIEDYLRHSSENIETKTDNLPLWVFWWQGRDAMPDIIEMCYKSKIRAAGAHPVVLLTKDNIKDYVEFPDYVWEQFSKGQLRIQHLADMIRVQLIAKYGGIWLDASIYCTDKIPENVYQSEIFSLRGKPMEEFVSKCRWTTFVIGGRKNNLLCSFLNDFFIQYCKKGKPFINYYMFDCAIAVAYDNLPKVKTAIDKLETSSHDYYWLNDHLRERKENLYIEMEQQELFQKIAWQAYAEDVPDADSLYAYLKQKEEEYAKS